MGIELPNKKNEYTSYVDKIISQNAFSLTRGAINKITFTRSLELTKLDTSKKINKTFKKYN